jgi:beta propeller domain-containing protein
VAADQSALPPLTRNRVAAEVPVDEDVERRGIEMRLPARRLARIGLFSGTAAAAIVAVSAAAVDVKPSRAKPVGAAAFRSCGALVDYASSQAIDTIGSGRLVNPVAMPVATPPPAAPVAPGGPVPALGAPEAGVQAAPMTSQPGVDHSPTNVQEAGIDEPDIVKTDGSLIFALDGQKLHAVDATEPTPRVVGSLAVKAGADAMLLHGDRLLLISRSSGDVRPVDVAIDEGGVRGASFVPGGGKTLLTEVNVHDPASMHVVRTMRIDGAYVDARLKGGTARLVFGSHPRVLGPRPNPGPQPETDQARRQRLMSTGVGGWLPSYVLQNRRTGRKAKHKLVRCRAVRRARAFSGLDLLTVLTIDLDKGLSPVDSDALMTDADTVYASSQSLYVATERWLDPDQPQQGPPDSATVIHKFDIGEPDRTHYRASGELPGYLLNQFSLSEHKGFLRAATTERPSGWGGDVGQSESYVTVLDERAGKLAEVGRVGGLGRGERVYSVRFIEDAAFVVTFRQIDPLYSVDLSTPERPRVAGELKIRGYSAYLHPVGKDLLIGVGQDATEQGQVLGTQISLFDVSDLARPVRLDHRTFAGGSSSEVEYDHHAFLYWPPSKLAVAPVSVYGGGRNGAAEFVGAIGFRISRGGGIGEAGRIVHPGDASGFATPVRRALVARGRLFTVSARGVEVSNLGTLGELAWVPFG